MRATQALLWMVSLGLTGMGTAHAAVHDHLYANGFEIPADAPANDAEAARFLTQATFGPTTAEIARVRALGYSEWIDQQLAAPTTLARPFVEQVTAARTAGAQGFDQTQRYDRWFWIATYGQDQLRQRMAWALSQIFVISDQSSAISGDVIPMTEYWDLLARDAFFSYRGLLGDVTFSPTMGKFLSHFRNQKASATTSPDENYAREVMQLFSVGLIQRDIDFTPLPGNLPTYDQTVITHTAKVFTGFTYSDAPVGSGAPSYSGANFYGGAITGAGSYGRMACWGTELFPVTGTGSGNMRHDVTGDDGTTATPKTLLGGLTVPANQSCHQDVLDTLNIIEGHANVAPFISRQLIQRFVTSNPSPAYIQRVAQVFESNGSGERGDLGAVVKAILLDPDARTVPTDPVESVYYGKLREPLLRLTALWRAWDAQAPAPNAYGEIKMSYTTNLLNTFGQRVLSAPTVFNFYEPDYQQPGYFADHDLYSPELEITNESTTYSTSNTLYGFIQNAYIGMTSPPIDRPLLNLAPISSLVNNPAAMVAEANRRMMYGSMSTDMQSLLVSMLQFMNTASANEKAWSLVYVIAMSPEFAAQR